MQSSKDPLPVDLHSMCLFPQQQVVRTLANFCPPGSSLETPRPRFYWELLTEAVSAWMTPYIQTPRRKAGVQMSWLSSWVSNSPCRFWICQTLHNHENKFLKIPAYLCIYLPTYLSSIYRETGKKDRECCYLFMVLYITRILAALWTSEIPLPFMNKVFMHKDPSKRPENLSSLPETSDCITQVKKLVSKNVNPPLQSSDLCFLQFLSCDFSTDYMTFSFNFPGNATLECTLRCEA